MIGRKRIRFVNGRMGQHLAGFSESAEFCADQGKPMAFLSGVNN